MPRQLDIAGASGVCKKDMKSSIRAYGAAPYSVAVIHGGPGAPGYMAPVARELAKSFGVIEPLQTRTSLEGQIQELHEQTRASGKGPFVLIGSSWGAVLALLTTAEHPELARKLILVGSAVFDAESSAKTKARRRERTSHETLAEIALLEKELASSSEKDLLFARIADLELDPDVYAPLTRDLELLETQLELNQSVWHDFKKLRDTQGALGQALSRIHCEVVLVHGDYDPHGIEGIHPFLKSVIPQTRLEWLERCGHYPWIEKFAREEFFAILRRECDPRQPRSC